MCDEVALVAIVNAHYTGKECHTLREVMDVVGLHPTAMGHGLLALYEMHRRRFAHSEDYDLIMYGVASDGKTECFASLVKMFLCKA